ncbi:MAG: DnaB-like helicase C-terminal domain-containing protein [Clostridia bacterium]
MPGDDRTLQSVYTANDVATYTMEVVDRRREEKGRALRSGISTLDRYMRPLLPGEVMFVSAYTSWGKTAIMECMARNVVRDLVRWQDPGRIVVYISWETLTEELGLYDLCCATGLDASRAWYGELGDQETELLRGAAFRRSAMPLWVLGYSLKRRRSLDALTMPVVLGALKAVEESYGVKPAMIFLDYIQKVPPVSDRDDRRVQVLKNVDAAFQLARDTGAPVVVGCQAGRQVLDRTFKLPELGDGQETSRIEQDADKVLGMWYPCKTEPDGAEIHEVPGVRVTPNLIIAGLRKQRHAASGQVFPLWFDPARNVFTGWAEGGEVDDGE